MRIVRIGQNNMVGGQGRGLNLVIINKSDHSLVSEATYDTHGSYQNSINLAAALDGMNENQIGILTSYDAWENKYNENSLIAALKRLGLYKAINTTPGDAAPRRPYAAIFEGSSSSGVASSHVTTIEYGPDVDGGAYQPFAEIRGWLIDGGFVASGSVPSGLSTPTGEIALSINEEGNVGIKTLPTNTNALTVNGDVTATTYYYFRSKFQNKYTNHLFPSK